MRGDRVPEGVGAADRAEGGPSAGARARWIVAVALAATLAWTPGVLGVSPPPVEQDPTPAGAPQQSGLRCQLCHAQPEFLRQQVETAERAAGMHVPPRALETSAHGGMTCADCHRGFDAFPHREEGVSTEACGSCHASADSAWRSGAHAPGDQAPPEETGGASPAREGRTTAGCSDCHGVHDVLAAERLRDEAGIRGMNGRCVECHATSVIPRGAPHADSVACHACHRSHDVRHVETAASAVAAARQAATCGPCHDDVAPSWVEDVHGSAVTGNRELAAESEEEDDDVHAPPSCTTCHGQHGMTRLATEAEAGPEVSRCRDCHEEYADTFGDSYHGQAVTLGSPAAASCADCHTGHAIYPASNSRSSVAQANLVETCGACHPRANASFVEFEPHADPHDREKNPVLYWTYKFMTFLLVSVLGVFGLHTLLWVIRVGVAAVRGEAAHGASPGRGEGEA